ncbi:MAG: methyltransferase domain-containing protein [Mariprofundales bacterium]
MARHKVCHQAISKEDWLASQQRQLDGWLDAEMLETQRTVLHDRYFEAIQRLLPRLDEGSEIVDIGSGPVCFSQEIPLGHKTFIDPLLDDLRRVYPGSMPKDAVYLNSAAEGITLPSNCVDLVICMNMLSFSKNPEEVMYEISRLLKPNGVLLLAVQISSSLVARLHYFGNRLFPFVRRHTRPYRFCQHAMEHTIARHLQINECISIVRRHPLKLFGDHECLFSCSPLDN